MLPSVEHVDLVGDMELRDYLQGEVFWFRVEGLECVRVLKGESVCACVRVWVCVREREREREREWESGRERE